jgi:hypothetical protein
MPEADALGPGGVAFAAEVTTVEAADVRIANMIKRLEQTGNRLEELLKPEIEETPQGILGALKEALERISNAIGAFFEALFETSDPALENIDARIAAQRIEIEVGDLKDLLQIRHDCDATRQRLHALEDAQTQVEMSSLRTELQNVRSEASSLQDLVAVLKDRLAVVSPGDPMLIPTTETPTLPTGNSLFPPFTPGRDVTETTERTVGDPESDKQYVDVQGDNALGKSNTCAVVAQEMIMDKFAGRRDAYDETALVRESIDRGWSDADGGSIPFLVGELAKAHGFRAENKPLSDITELVKRLESGEEAVVGVNGGMLWNDPTAMGDGSANHAVWVTGAKVKETNGQIELITVFINDSGSGKSIEVDGASFEKMWNTSGKHAIYISSGGRN